LNSWKRMSALREHPNRCVREIKVCTPRKINVL